MYEKEIIVIRKAVQKEILYNASLTDEDIKNLIFSEIINVSKDKFISKQDKQTIQEIVFNELRRLGKIEPILQDNSINEVMINGKNKVFVEKSGEIIETGIKFTEVELDNLIQKMVSSVNRSVNKANPIVDARLRDGSRINVVLDPVAINGPIVTIRKFSDSVLTIDNLLENKTLTKELADYLEMLVKTKHNIFISGGTGSGKTTLLNILSNFINENERIITIEDSAELKLNHIKNIVSLETRNKNTEGVGQITMTELIRTSLRMRPDRIIVGEVRGKETFDMLQAMNTGHDGSISTGHSNSAEDMLVRLESMILMNYDIPIIAVRRQIASALDVIIHVSKNDYGERRVTSVTEVVGYEGDKYILNEIFSYNNGRIVKKNDMINRLKSEGYVKG